MGPVGVAPLAESDLNVKLRRVQLREASLPETVTEVRRQWSKARGGASVPAITIVEPASDGNEQCRPTITCDLLNIPVTEFLRLIHPATGYRVEVVAGAILLRAPRPGIIEDWETAILPVSAVGQRFLQLAPETPPAVLTTRLKSLGVPFPEGEFSARWSPEVQKIVITTYPRGVGKLEGLLWLLDHGYKIIEPKAQPRHATDG